MVFWKLVWYKGHTQKTVLVFHTTYRFLCGGNPLTMEPWLSSLVPPSAGSPGPSAWYLIHQGALALQPGTHSSGSLSSPARNPLIREPQFSSMVTSSAGSPGPPPWYPLTMEPWPSTLVPTHHGALAFHPGTHSPGSLCLTHQPLFSPRHHLLCDANV